MANPIGVRFSKVPVPSNYREARASEQWEYWEMAMNEEKNSLDAHDCFEYVDRPMLFVVNYKYLEQPDNDPSVVE